MIVCSLILILDARITLYTRDETNHYDNKYDVIFYVFYIHVYMIKAVSVSKIYFIFLVSLIGNVYCARYCRE